MYPIASQVSSLFLFGFAAVWLGQCSTLAAQLPSQKHGQTRFQRHARRLEGWNVQVDVQLLEGQEADFGKHVLRALEGKLREVSLVLPKDRIERLQQVTICIDLNHPLKSCQYHPSRGWLISHGYDPKLEKVVHIPDARRFFDLVRSNHQPWVVLHELAHAYHDQVLGFNYPAIKEHFRRIVEAKRYETVLHIQGHTTRHYALTNHKEYFAEMTEAYVGTNDFYPFVRGELKQHDQQTYQLLKQIWTGPDARQVPPEPEHSGRLKANKNEGETENGP